MALAIGFLALVAQCAVQPLLAASPAALAADEATALAQTLASRVPSTAELQRVVAADPRLRAVDWVGPEGLVRASSDPAAIGRPADEGLSAPGWRQALPDADGQAQGWIVVHAPGPGSQAAPGRWWPALMLALLLPPAAAALALWLGGARPPPPGPELAEARQRLRDARLRLARAAIEVEWLEADASAGQTGVYTRTGVTRR